MRTRNPARLLRLAGESLLRDQVAVIAALKYLPTQLFLPLFILACLQRKWEPLKAMVQAWPCSVLPLGSLGRLPPVMVLKAVLEGLADLSAQNVHPSRWKVQVLDLRSMDVNLRRRWYAHSTLECSQTGLVAVHCSSPNMDHALPHLKVVLDINFSEMGTFKFYMYVIQWAQQQREAVVHLCCKMLKFYEFPLQRARKVLDRVKLDCIQEVQVFCTWDLPTLGAFANYLGQMTNLQSLSLNHIKELREGENEQEEEEEEEEMEEVEMEEEEEVQEEEEQEEQKEKMEDLEEEYLRKSEGAEQEWESEEQEWEREEQEEQEEQEEHVYVSRFLSQMGNLRHLKKLYLHSPSFLRDRLDEMLRRLQTPLDELLIGSCRQLWQSDLTHLFQCPNLRQLKSLCLYFAKLADFGPKPLRALLEAVAPTLQDLHLDNCGMVDCQFEPILPVLSRCHQLREFTITENSLSVATLKKLLCHTAKLRSLELEYYPVPLECYGPQKTVDQERVALIRAELMETLRELGQRRTIRLCTNDSSTPEMCLCSDLAH